MGTLSEYIGDYTTSENFLFLDPGIKEHAESLLSHWCGQMEKAITYEGISASFKNIAALDLSLEVRRSFPGLLREFFEYLSSSGRAPQAEEWVVWVNNLEKKYLEGFRKDGTIRGETYRKKYSKTSRNEPCPCGSGKKFKKCCMNLMA
ncbi:MAG: SEC-C metal-binding domain-containing protein [bacterium]